MKSRPSVAQQKGQKIQGLTPYMVAFHEAAHAVVGLQHRIDIVRCTKTYTHVAESKSFGHRVYRKLRGQDDFQRVEPYQAPYIRNFLTMLLSGSAAVQSLGGPVGTGADDFASARRLLRKWGATDDVIEKEMRRAAKRACDWVHRLHVEIVSVADVLVRTGRLSRRQIDAILAGSAAPAR